jgi:hypothetical protein
MRPRIAFVSHAGTTAADAEGSLLLEALARAGLDVVDADWDDGREWAEFDLVLVRAPRDHRSRRQGFLRWARDVEDSTTLVNPAVSLARTTDRTYLRDLRRQGVPVVPTVWFEPGDDPVALRRDLNGSRWPRFTVGPNVAGSDAGPVHAPTVDAAAREAAAIAGRGLIALIRPADVGAATVSVVVLGNRVSHAVAEGPDGAVREVEATADLVDAAMNVLRACASADRVLYARVDLVEGLDCWELRELTTSEPRLFLDVVPEAADTLAWVVRQAVVGDV